MAARNIKVDSDQLRNWANEISGLAGDYQKSYQAIQVQVDDLANTWKGEDSTTYRNKVHEFDDDFQKMFDEIGQYVEYLEKVAAKYDEVRSDAMNRANALKGNYR